jgi:hypothetical protein
MLQQLAKKLGPLAPGVAEPEPAPEPPFRMEVAPSGGDVRILAWSLPGLSGCEADLVKQLVYDPIEQAGADARRPHDERAAALRRRARLARERAGQCGPEAEACLAEATAAVAAGKDPSAIFQNRRRLEEERSDKLAEAEVLDGLAAQADKEAKDAVQPAKIARRDELNAALKAGWEQKAAEAEARIREALAAVVELTRARAVLSALRPLYSEDVRGGKRRWE